MSGLVMLFFRFNIYHYHRNLANLAIFSSLEGFSVPLWALSLIPKKQIKWFEEITVIIFDIEQIKKLLHHNRYNSF